MVMQPVSQPEYHAFLGEGVEGRKKWKKETTRTASSLYLSSCTTRKEDLILTLPIRHHLTKPTKTLQISWLSFTGARIPLWGFGIRSEHYFFPFFFFLFCVLVSFSHPSCHFSYSVLIHSASLERFLSVAVLLKHLWAKNWWKLHVCAKPLRVNAKERGNIFKTEKRVLRRDLNWNLRRHLTFYPKSRLRLLKLLSALGTN